MRFLIVDDDPCCRLLLKAMLEGYADCDLAFDGSEAVEAVRLSLQDERPYDLILLDIMMPGVDGHAALERIRQLEYDRGIRGSDGTKVIMATALRDSQHCIRSFREGCEAYITKPIKEPDLLKQVRNLLGELPEVLPRPEPTATCSAAVPDSHPQNPNAQNPTSRFLVVDDDGVCRALIDAIISPFGKCTFAYDGAEAIDAVRLAIEDGQPFDLICLDIMMPGVSGHDALTAIRKFETEHGILGSDGVKVIMTTALSDSKHCMQSFKEGCEHYVTKPIDQDELLDKMQQLGLISLAETQ